VKSKAIRFITKGSIYFLLICICYIYMLPLLRMISSIFMPEADIIDPAVDWIPRNFSIMNIRVAFNVLNIRETLVNSIWYSGLLAAAQTFVSALAGYAFARFNFRFKKVLFVLLLATFIMPLPILMIPRWIMFVSVQTAVPGLQLIGTPIPQTLMAILGQGVNSTILILIFYSFLRLIPYSLDEAAMIDGASAWQVFWHIIIKMSLTTILVVFLFSFVWNWNETTQTSSFLRGGISLLPMQLTMFESLFYGAVVGTDAQDAMLNEAYRLTATFVTIAPLLILYGFVQRFFIAGIENTGITGE